jgi:hypothetical protein
MPLDIPGFGNFKMRTRPPPYVREDNYRRCAYCDNWIGQCFGFTNAGDFILAIEGLLPISEVRERCGTCVLRHCARREGYYGPYVVFACFIYDTCRRISWFFQRYLLYPTGSTEEK